MKKVFLQSYDTTSEYGEITFIHYDPFNPDERYGLHMSEEQLNSFGKVVEVPDSCDTDEAILTAVFSAPAIVDNTRLVPKINNVTRELSYEYVAIPPVPKTPRELLEEQQAQILILQDTINTLLGL